MDSTGFRKALEVREGRVPISRCYRSPITATAACRLRRRCHWHHARGDCRRRAALNPLLLTRTIC